MLKDKILIMSSNNDSCFRPGENCIPSIVVTIRYRVLRPFGLIGVEWIFSIRCGKSAYALLIIKYLHCPKGIRKKIMAIFNTQYLQIREKCCLARK
jgi:hypothetical protein